MSNLIKALLAIGTVAVASLAATQPALAHGYGHGEGFGRPGYGGQRIDEREARQEWRIRQGVASGELTHREAYRLEREQAYIRHAEREARADGYLSRGERARIEAMQDEASRHIRYEKHDGEFRRW